MARASSSVDLFIVFVIELVKGVEYHLQVVLDVRHLVAEVFDDFFFSHCLEIVLTPRTPRGSGRGSRMVLMCIRRRGR